MTLLDPTTPVESRSESNSKEGLLYTPNIYRTGALPSDTVKCHTQTLLIVGLIFPYDILLVYYKP